MPMNQQVSAQAQERLLSRLSSMGVARPAATALLERHMLVRYRKGAELFSMGSPADVVFAVLTGLVKVHSSRPGSDPVLVDLAGPGDLVGYADFTGADGVRSQLFGATAVTNCCVALFTRHQNFRGAQGPRAGGAGPDCRGDQFDVVVGRLPLHDVFGNVAAQTARDCSGRVGGAIRRARLARNAAAARTRAGRTRRDDWQFTPDGQQASNRND